MMSRTVCLSPVALMSAHPAAGEGEVVLPVGTVEALLPGTANGVPILAEGAGETLPEIQGREVRRLPRERPHPTGKGHGAVPGIYGPPGAGLLGGGPASPVW